VKPASREAKQGNPDEILGGKVVVRDKGHVPKLQEFCVGISGGCASVHNVPTPLKSRYIYCFVRSWGIQAPFIFISFHSVVYSI